MRRSDWIMGATLWACSREDNSQSSTSFTLNETCTSTCSTVCCQLLDCLDKLCNIDNPTSINRVQLLRRSCYNMDCLEDCGSISTGTCHDAERVGLLVWLVIPSPSNEHSLQPLMKPFSLHLYNEPCYHGRTSFWAFYSLSMQSICVQ